MTSSNIKLRTAAVIAATALLMSLLSIAVTAQTPNRNSLPKVGTIKDYPATGLMTGCGNLYFYKAADANSTTANYVFLSSGDGRNAWMNLNGRDVRLRIVKVVEGSGRQFGRIYYRHGQVRITLRFEYFKPRDAAAESDPMFSMTITLQRGRAVRIVRAVGSADC